MVHLHRPKVGLALGGGGARGLAHIGVLNVLEREGIPIDVLAGTSMGGLIAAGYAAGLSPTFMEQEALRMGQLWRLVGLFDLALAGAGLVEGRKIEAYLARHLGEMTFNDLRTPLALMAVDLVTGEEVVLKSGSVIEAVRATISLPGAFAPVRLNDRLLVDGGVLNNLPADVVRQMGADVVIAVDVSIILDRLPGLLEAEGHVLPLTQGPLIIETLRRTIWIMEKRATIQRLQEARPEVLIRPPIDNEITIFIGFHRAAECIAAGEGAATAALPRIRSLLRRQTS